MIENSLVSVICNTYNHEHFIRVTIEGFLMQKTTFPIEILIHDDASTDGTADIIREYEQKYPELILPIYQTENQHSKGKKPLTTYQFPRVSGKYIAICEGDDYWTDPLKLQKQVDILENPENNNIIAVATDSAICDPEGKIFPDRKFPVVKENKTGIYTLHSFFADAHTYPTATVMFRNIIPEILRDLQYLSNPYLMDWILWILLHCKGDFYYLNEITSCYRINPNSLTHTRNNVNRWKHDFIIRQQLREIIPSEYHQYLNSDWAAYIKIASTYRMKRNYVFFNYYMLRSAISDPIKHVNHLLHKIRKRF